MNEIKFPDSINELNETIKNAVDEWISESVKKGDNSVSISGFLERFELYKSLENCVEEAINMHAAVNNCCLDTGEIAVEFKPIVTTKFYSPIAVMTCDPEDYSEDMVDVDSRVLCDYEEIINARIIKSLSDIDEEKSRGLAAYLDDPLSCRVLSYFPSVEVIDGEIYGVSTVKTYGELDDKALAELLDEITGQYSDGWGEGFEQREFRFDGQEYYVSFWNSSNFYIKPENEIFPEQDISPTMT